MYKEPSNTQITANTFVYEEMTRSLRARYVRYFFVVMAFIFTIIIVIGFTPSYQAINAGQIKPHWFVHLHGAIMASWLIVFLVQAILAAKGNLKFHRQLGQFSVVLGIVVCFAMATASIRARVAGAPPMEDVAWDILLVELYNMSLFSVFFAWGILVRKKTAAHKRLLFAATLVLIQAGVDRIQWLPGLHEAVFVRFFYLDLLLIPLLVYDFFSVRKIHQVTLIVSTIIIAVQLSVTMLWGSPTWHQFWFNRLAPFVQPTVEVKLSDEQITLLLGDYGDQNWALTISRDGDKLYLQLPQTDKVELAATSETELFVKTMMWKLSFVKADDGSVTKLINKQASSTWEVPRFK